MAILQLYQRVHHPTIVCIRHLHHGIGHMVLNFLFTFGNCLFTFGNFCLHPEGAVWELSVYIECLFILGNSLFAFLVRQRVVDETHVHI